MHMEEHVVDLWFTTRRQGHLLALFELVMLKTCHKRTCYSPCRSIDYGDRKF
jgi:hypothetical protein